jgi:phosphohistidine phosphatase
VSGGEPPNFKGSSNLDGISMANKPDSYYKQSAVLPIKKDEGEYYILLITSKNQNKWVIPKGIVEENMTARESAEKEAIEEAGILGKTSKKSIGSYEYEKWGGKCMVEVFPCKVKTEAEEWDEMHFRKRKWFPLDKALKKLKNEQLEILIKKYFKNNSK